MVGGMEKTSYSLAHQFSKSVDTTLITWGKSQKYLPIVLPLFFIKALYIIPKEKITHVHIGDALLSPLGLILKKIYNVKTSITIHGLDIIFNFPGYQFIVPKAVSQLDKIICVSNATLQECLKRGIPKSKSIVINWGVDSNEWTIKATRKDLEKIVGQNLDGKKILITVGRLVKRKGVYWFIENVLPKLDKNTTYLVIGEGPEMENIKNLIDKLDLQKSVFLLGKISDKELKTIYNTADMFVMPNIKVDTSFEGFGMVAVEASSTGLPVVASKLEGIEDAVIDNKNGYLIDSKNRNLWINKIRNITKISRNQIRSWTEENYNWDKVGKSYLKYIYEN